MLLERCGTVWKHPDILSKRCGGRSKHSDGKFKRFLSLF
jgi:hypothetical protein